jgi:hypothetical protein
MNRTANRGDDAEADPREGAHVQPLLAQRALQRAGAKVDTYYAPLGAQSSKKSAMSQLSKGIFAVEFLR